MYKPLPTNVFNGNRLRFTDLNIDLSLNEFKKDTLSVEIKSFSAREKSGLVIQDFSTQIFL